MQDVHSRICTVADISMSGYSVIFVNTDR